MLGGQSTYIEGVAGTAQRVNPLFASSNEVDEDLVQLVFAGLLRVSPDGTLAPDLAALPDVSADGKTYTFHVRTDANWQDGAPITSRDVAFTVKALTDPGFRGDPALAEAWAGVDVQTPTTPPSCSP